MEPNAFQIKPDLSNILQAEKVKHLIQEVLQKELLNKNYSTENARKWTKSISDDINRGLKEVATSEKYKHVVQVVIFDVKFGQGFKFTARCRWDCETDRQITDSFSNESMTCVVSVFGVYSY